MNCPSYVKLALFNVLNMSSGQYTYTEMMYIWTSIYVEVIEMYCNDYDHERIVLCHLEKKNLQLFCFAPFPTITLQSIPFVHYYN